MIMCQKIFRNKAVVDSNENSGMKKMKNSLSAMVILSFALYGSLKPGYGTGGCIKHRKYIHHLAHAKILAFLLTG